MDNEAGLFQPEIAVQLVELGADWKIKDKFGNSLLHKLLQHGCDDDLVERLTTAAPDMIHLRDEKNNMTPFHCLRNGKYQTILSEMDIGSLRIGISIYKNIAEKFFINKKYDQAIEECNQAVLLFSRNIEK